MVKCKVEPKCVFHGIGRFYGKTGMRRSVCAEWEEDNGVKQFAEVYKNILMLTQFGLSFITPLLLCLAFSWWLTSRFSLGGWVYIPGFFFGMGGSGMVAYKFYLSILGQQKKKDREKKTVSYNRHI